MKENQAKCPARRNISGVYCVICLFLSARLIEELAGRFAAESDPQRNGRQKCEAAIHVGLTAEEFTNENRPLAT
jgi:hypothetical protein